MLATTSDQVATIITTMVVRGAPAIGVAAAMGVALGSQVQLSDNDPSINQRVGIHFQDTGRDTPHRSQSVLGHRTHRRRFFALAARPGITIAAIQEGLVAEARTMYDEDIASLPDHGRAQAPH